MISRLFRTSPPAAISEVRIGLITIKKPLPPPMVAAGLARPREVNTHRYDGNRGHPRGRPRAYAEVQADRVIGPEREEIDMNIRHKIRRSGDGIRPFREGLLGARSRSASS
jgi:hypothetical protein